jgi:hypothetical protein
LPGRERREFVGSVLLPVAGYSIMRFIESESGSCQINLTNIWSQEYHLTLVLPRKALINLATQQFIKELLGENHATGLNK